jgi:hypothetical protein
MFGKLLRGGDIKSPPELPLAFRLQSERALRIQQEYDPVNAWRFLSHNVRRYPQDLRAHTQRVLLAQHELLRDRLAGCLQDMFLALGRSGHLLREHLFELVKNNLDEDDQAFFTRWLQEGVTVEQTQQWRPGSLLSTGQDNKTVRLLDIGREQANAQYAHVMDEVFACLEYGQVDRARELLAAEVLAGNADEAMEQELVSIYQYTRDKEGLAAMIQQLQDAGRDIPALWGELQQESEQW